MTEEQFLALMDGTGIYYDPDHPDYIERSKVVSLPLPFLEFEWSAIPFFADGVNYYTRRRAEVRVYTDLESKAAEGTVFDALMGAELSFRINREFLPELDIWQTTYTMEV